MEQFDGIAIPVHQVLEEVVANMCIWKLLPQRLVNGVLLQRGQSEDRKVDPGELGTDKCFDFLVGTQFLLEIVGWKGQHAKAA